MIYLKFTTLFPTPRLFAPPPTPFFMLFFWYLTAINCVNPSNYACDPAKCLVPACKCPSKTLPITGKPPQFITLTFDDAVNPGIIGTINEYISSYINPNGCPLKATYFVSTQYTDYWLVQRLYSMGHEIALHTMNHVTRASFDEIKGSLEALNSLAGVPRSKITGFRQPFLNYSTASVRNIAQIKEIVYDSSMAIYNSGDG